MASPAPADRPPTLTLGPGASQARRALGPIAWAVLECVATGAVERGDQTVSHQSVRGLADSLGLAKDTVARALRRLAADQLLAYVSNRGHDGRFGTCHYRLTIPAGVFHGVRTDTSTSASRTPKRSSHHPPGTQLSLIDPPSPDA